MLTKIDKIGAIAKVKILKESDNVKRLKKFRIISSKMPVSLLVQC